MKNSSVKNPKTIWFFAYIGPLDAILWHFCTILKYSCSCIFYTYTLITFLQQSCKFRLSRLSGARGGLYSDVRHSSSIISRAPTAPLETAAEPERPLRTRSVSRAASDSSTSLCTASAVCHHFMLGPETQAETTACSLEPEWLRRSISFFFTPCDKTRCTW